MNNPNSFASLMALITISIVLIACTSVVPAGATAESLFVGTWRSDEDSLQLAANHTFLLKSRDSLLGVVELRGEWKIDGGRVYLIPNQGKVEGGGAQNISWHAEDPNITVTINDPGGGSRMLRLDDNMQEFVVPKEYRYVSADADVPGPWEVSPPPELDIVTS